MNAGRKLLFAFVAFWVLVLGAGWPGSSHALAILQTICDQDFSGCPPGVNGLDGAWAVAVSPDGKHVYVAATLDHGVMVFSRNEQTGNLAFVQRIDSSTRALRGSRGVAVSPDGKSVYVAALSDSTLTAFSRNATTGILTFVETETDGVGGVDGLALANAVIVSPDNEHVYVAGRHDDAVAVFRRDTVTGAVTFLQVLKHGVGGVSGLDAPEALAISPDGKHVYAAAETSSAVTVFSRNTLPADPNFGKLTFVEAKVDGVGGVDGINGAGAVAVSPDGKHVYVGAQRGPIAPAENGGDWAAVFSRHAATGALTFVESHREDMYGTSSTGIFNGCNGIGNENSGVAVTPDGGFVYLTNPWRSTVAQFKRNATTGQLALADAICDTDYTNFGLVGVRGVTVSPDGRHIFANSSSTSSLFVLIPTARRFDFDSDGKSDLFWQHAGTGETYAWLMNGAAIAASGSPATVTDANWKVVGTGDFDGGGKADVFWRHAVTGQTALWQMNGAAIAASAFSTTVADLNWKVLGTADFDNNGKADLFWQHAGTGQTYVWLMNGAAIAASASPATVTDANWKVAGIGDFDGDGKVDVFWRHAVTGQTAVWLMNGTAIASSAYSTTVADPNWKVLGTGDFDGNGKADLFWQHAVTGQVYVWLMNGAAIAASASPATVADLNWKLVGTGDYDGDGKADVFWRHAVTGQTAVWLMNGSSIASSASSVTVPDLNWQVQNPR